ncbi:Aspartyl-tRNA(Asn) amidotransferase subunit C @ Glutamyl-tRNA(Gln) amidotransferase subunit C [hydrothermal vent metagenome]|uniref:Aspartyl-tRNA(Asn) amidotransferase subunit C @ Glutamyl-tRNA(Gln) amidotransferase subunit C n=1 Tax=hydrothermal vent metagenome TaxID=652676 RepID=A0A3B0REC5_9ZZZZ
MAITKEGVQNVADLARLRLTEGDAELYAGQLGRILDYVEKLSEVDTTGVPPTTGGVEGSALRQDVAESSLSQEAALANAPDKQGGCFKVPKIIE